jgi:selenocysteine-specific elongation factor
VPLSSLVVGTAGHIDHGKSALVKALTGTDPDRLKEEQARGITIDLGFAHATVGDVNVAFVDVPGHERFVRNMLAGAGGIDAVALVVAADESVMPQTREHFEICRLLGLDRGLIVITKADRVDADAIELAALEARELVAGSFLDGAPVVVTSARTGAGLDELRQALAALAGPISRQARSGVVRLPVDRVFTMKGFGTVVTGTLVSGEIVAGQDLVALPEGRVVRVRGIQVHGRDVTAARAPNRTAVNLGSVDVRDLTRGVTLASPGALTVTRRVDARLELLEGARPLRHGARVRVHQGTAERLGRIAVCAVAEADRQDWRLATVGESSVAVAGGSQAYVRIRLEQPLALTRADRLVLRTYSPPATIGGAVVLDPLPPASGLRRPAVLERFRASDATDAPADGSSAFVSVWLEEAGERGLTAQDLVARGGLGPDVSRAVLSSLLEAGRASSAEARVFSSSAAIALEHRVRSALEAFHRAQPRESGLPKEELRERVAPRAAPALVDFVLDAMASRGVIAGSDRVLLAAHRVPSSPDDERDAARVEALIRDAGLMPPDVAAIATAAGLTAAAAEHALKALARGRRIVKLESLCFHVDALSGLKREIQELGAARPSANAPARVDVAAFKERYGLSRKYAIPLLEWLDRERVTRRVGDARVILSPGLAPGRREPA